MSSIVRLNVGLAGGVNALDWWTTTMTGAKKAGRNAIAGTGIAAVAVRSAVSGALVQVVAC